MKVTKINILLVVSFFITLFLCYLSYVNGFLIGSATKGIISAILFITIIAINYFERTE